MVFFYVLLVVIGALASPYLGWRSVFALSLTLALAASLALFWKYPGAILHVALGLVALQVSYLLAGVAIEEWLRSRSADQQQETDRHETRDREDVSRFRRW